MSTATIYRAVMLAKKGGPEMLQVVELPVEPPSPGQLRVRVRAAGVGATDLAVLAGNYLYAPKMPFVPGYEIAGEVEAIGAGVTGFDLGQRMAALTVYEGFAELLVREAEHFLPIPDRVSDCDAAAVILNYVTAWQMIHRVAKVRPGQTALVTGAAGGVGTAALRPLKACRIENLRRRVCGEAWDPALTRRNANRLPGRAARPPHPYSRTRRRGLRLRCGRRTQYRPLHWRAREERHRRRLWFPWCSENAF